ncbi:MAG TPA: hypothetical protein VJZ93_00165 [Candidatus Nanoarchaeia archaeon]|nr:hypothetical protein [Candidatus Nanoarchaeia archaeon]
MDLQARVIESANGKISFSRENDSYDKGKIIERLTLEIEEKDKEFERFPNTYKTMPCFREFTGIGKSLGHGFWYNTSGTSFQMMKTLELLEHPVLDKFLEDISNNDSITPNDIDVNPLVRGKILRGLKIMDLGCGIRPSYANCVHSLGAEVYTSDHNHPGDIHFIDDSMKQRYIAVDFNDKNVLGILRNRTRGEFDFVTCTTCFPTHLWSDSKKKIKEPSKERLKEIGLSLLRKNGIFYNPEDPRN